MIKKRAFVIFGRRLGGRGANMKKEGKQNKVQAEPAPPYIPPVQANRMRVQIYSPGRDSILFQAVSGEARMRNYWWGNELYRSCLGTNKNIWPRTPKEGRAAASGTQELYFSAYKSPS